MKMNITERIIFIIWGIGNSLLLNAQEQNNGELGLNTNGHINMRLQKPTGALAGLATASNNAGADNRSYVSTQVLEDLVNEKSARIPFCITSDDESSYEISSINTEGAQNQLQNEFGDNVPFDIAFGPAGENSIMYKSSRTNCDNNSTIPLTVNLEQPISGQSARRIRGKINLVVKAE